MKKFLSIITILAFFSLSMLAEESVYDRMLVKAFGTNNLIQAEKMLKKGANLDNYPYNLWIQDKSPSIKMMKLFAKYKVSMKTGSKCVLGDAIWSNYDFKVIKYLVDHGEDVHCYDGYYAPLIYDLAQRNWYQAYHGRSNLYKSTEYILKHGAAKDLNIFNKYEGEKAIVARYAYSLLYLKYGTKIDEICNKNKGTYPIHYFKYGEKNDKKAVEYIIKKGGNINILDGDGWTLLDYVHARKNDEYEMWLLEHGAKYNKFKELN